MERIELLAAPDNEPSNRVAQLAGFHFEGMKRNAGYVHSGRVDLNLYSLVRSDLDRPWYPAESRRRSCGEPPLQ